LRLVSKIKLINWHYFSNETVPLEGSVLITGDNGAGKSTLIDAMQVVIIANLKKIRFNSSAFEERTTRDLKGYLRGKTGTEGRYTYLRGDRDFSSYVVLEITHVPTKKPYLIGVVFDYYSGSGEEDHIFFKIDEHPLEDGLFFQDNVPRNRQQFFHYLKANRIKHRQYKHDIEGYLSDLRQLFGGVKDSFFSLFGKGISFSPITNLRSFVYDYVLEERPIDVETMRDYFEKFRQVENLIMETDREIKFLEKIEKSYQKVENLRERVKTGRYMQYRGRWEQLVLDLEEGKRQRGEKEARLKQLNGELEELKGRLKKLESEREKLAAEIAGHEAAQRERKLKDKIESLGQEIEKLKSKWANLCHMVKTEIGERERLIEVMRRVNAPFEACRSLMEGKEEWELFLGEGARFPEGIHEQARAWTESIDWLKNQKRAWDREREELKEREGELVRSIRELEKNQVLSSSSPTMRLKKLLEEYLVPEKDCTAVPVHVFCEAIDIPDGRWQNAIEGYLHTQKFDLLVPPGYFDDALSIYERYKFTHGIENVGLVNTEKLLKEVRPPLKGSLAEEITAAEDYVRAYADWLLGGVIKCEKEKELKAYRRAITPTCMLYQNHTARQIPKSRYEIPYIGKRAVKVQLARKREELERCRAALSQLEERLEIADSVSGLSGDKSDRYQRWKEIFNECRQREVLEREMLEIQQELLTLDRTELERLEGKKREVENELRHCEEEKEKIVSETGRVQTQLEGLAEKIERLACEEEECRRQFLSYEKTLPEELARECRKKWEREVQKKQPRELERNYGTNIQALNTMIGKQMREVVRMRTDFVHEFNFSGDPDSEDNRAFEERCRVLKESHLREYREEARNAREKAEHAFKEHFVARLREAIDLAREEINELNRALKDLKFGTDTYRFSISPRPGMKEYYDMIMDPDLHMGETLFSRAFRERHGDTLDSLFREITGRDEDFSEKMQDLTDYRSYLDFEIVITDERGNRSYFSKVSRDKSGGETQVPFYVAILASFYQAYHLYRKKDTLRLVVFDEAFNRLDADNVEECVRFIKKLGFQAFIVAPTGKIQLIVPHVNTIAVVMREGFESFVERVTRRDIEQWASREKGA